MFDRFVQAFCVPDTAKSIVHNLDFMKHLRAKTHTPQENRVIEGAKGTKTRPYKVGAPVKNGSLKRAAMLVWMGRELRPPEIGVAAELRVPEIGVAAELRPPEMGVAAEAGLLEARLREHLRSPRGSGVQPSAMEVYAGGLGVVVIDRKHPWDAFEDHSRKGGGVILSAVVFEHVFEGLSEGLVLLLGPRRFLRR